MDKDTIIRRYLAGGKKRGQYQNVNVFYTQTWPEVLNSYRQSWPLVARRRDGAEFGKGIKYIVNGDKFSPSTNQHTWQVIRASAGENVQVPYSALREAWNWSLRKKLGLLEWDTLRHEMYQRTRGFSPTLAWSEFYEWERIHEPANQKTFGEIQARDVQNLGYRLVQSAEHDDWISVVDRTQDSWVYWPVDGNNRVIPGAPKFSNSNDCSRWCTENNRAIGFRSSHSLGGVLLKIHGSYFISGWDEIDQRNYFLCHTPGEPKTMSEALENLKPWQVQQAEAQGRRVLRQGEWFFIESLPEATGTKKLRDRLYPNEARGYRLGSKPGDDGRGTGLQHVASRVRWARLVEDLDQTTAPGESWPWVVVHGTVKHLGGEHKRLTLGDRKAGSWWVPIKNTSEAGWAAMGMVD